MGELPVARGRYFHHPRNKYRRSLTQESVGTGWDSLLMQRTFGLPLHLADVPFHYYREC